MTTEPLLAFASAFGAGITHHREVRTGALAEGFREWVGLGAFPHQSDLLKTCELLGVGIDSLPAQAPMEGLNTWVEGGIPTIFLRPG